jgi:xylulokinase
MLAAVDPQRDLADCLPPLRAENTAIGSLRAEVARQLGLPAAIPVSTGGGDNMMGAIGTGNVAAGAITISLGTSGTVYAYSDQPVIDPAGNIAAFCSSTGGWLPLMCTMNCTVTTELLRGLLHTDISTFEAMISRAPRGADGVLTLPFFNGERTPNLPRAKACIVGLDAQNMRPENLLRSGVEGATFALRYGIDELRGLGIETDQVMLTGGGVKSAKWRQIVADICAAPVTVFNQDEGASFGAALQALHVIEGCANNELPGLVQQHLTRNEAMCCEPRNAAVHFYNDHYQDYRAAVDAVTGLYA